MEEFFASWDEGRIEIVYGPVEVEDGLLIAGNVTYMRGRKGSEVQPRSAWLITIRNGEQTSLTTYQTKQEALEAGTRWRRSTEALGRENRLFAGILGMGQGWFEPPTNGL